MVSRVVATTLLLCFSQLILAQAGLLNGPPRPLVLRPLIRTGGGILYRRHQLEPSLMRRSEPQEVLERYARRNRENNELLTKLNPTGIAPIFYGHHSSRTHPRYSFVLVPIAQVS